MEKDYKPISDKHLLALHMMSTPKKDSVSFFADVYSAVSELIERRKASGEWRGLIDDDGHKGTD